MKLLVFVLFIPVVTFSQKSEYNMAKIVDTLKYLTIEIMNRLQITVRTNWKMDGKFGFQMDPTLSGFDAEFKVNVVSFTREPKRMEDRFYKFPAIYFSQKSDSLCRNFTTISQNYKLLMLSLIAHELCHCYQLTRVENAISVKSIIGNAIDSTRYMNQPTEKEAYAVGAFYLLQYLNPILLQTIMSNKTNSIFDKRSLLIQAYFMYF